MMDVKMHSLLKMKGPSLSTLILFGFILSGVLSYVVSPPPPIAPKPLRVIPPFSPSTGLENKVYEWRGQRIRYIVSGPADATKSALLIHGLFVNADHWRRTIRELGDAGYRTYAIDLLGSGYSSKPSPGSLEARLLNGENGRFETYPKNEVSCDRYYSNHRGKQDQYLQRPIRDNLILGTASGGRKIVKHVNLRHPLGSCYNFYTFAEQVSDFTRDVIFEGTDQLPDGTQKTTSLVANSKGTIVALQAVLDTPEYYDGVCAINPTYREMHHAEMRFPSIMMPVVNLLQKFLRSKQGKDLYYHATQRDCIKNILKEPYNNIDAIDDELVTAMMDPLNLPNAAEVVFDELSYTTGPLFEQLLQDIKSASIRKPLWVCYGVEDPWLSPNRVESLMTTPFGKQAAPVVDKVVAIANAGHCPHDERPEITNPIILDFLKTCKGMKASIGIPHL
eukprot:CAMPEP_0183729396 /NCGR_PEP_ID=MMETSP0737-20130205/30136_1 /TAXON_ID=385413 /ORGANISM="Thalassiosira miniscula, Strain CCMP1093" /LENGTH=447 /DNA_ID=CAMNT_0025961559 /DNA_START=9 /DNA_END=1352 /DNA_ORIENTATION=+